MCWHRDTHVRNHRHQHQHRNHDSIPFISVRSSSGARQRDFGGILHVCGSMGHFTALGARTLAWLQAESCRTRSAEPMFGKQGTSCRGSTSRQTMEACHSCSDTRGTSVFSWPQSTDTKRSSWNTVSRNEAGGSAQHPRGQLRSGGDGFPLRRRSHPGRGVPRRPRRLPGRHGTEGARHAPVATTR